MEANFSEVNAAFASNSDIPVGTPVVYAMHGKCTIIAIETREMAGEKLRFYKLEIQRSPLSRTSRLEPAIWVPVSTAQARGIRSPMTLADVDAAFLIFSNREYYLNPSDPWNVVQNTIEVLVRNEGSIGTAKALSFLHVLKKKQVVAKTEVTRLNESLVKLFTKEVSELTSETMKAVEERMIRAMKNKLLADH